MDPVPSRGILCCPPELVTSQLPELLRRPPSEHSENQSPTERAADGVQRGPRVGSRPLIPNNYSPQPAPFSCKSMLECVARGELQGRTWTGARLLGPLACSERQEVRRTCRGRGCWARSGCWWIMIWEGSGSLSHKRGAVTSLGSHSGHWGRGM